MKNQYSFLWRSNDDEPTERFLEYQMQKIRKTKLLAQIFALLALAAFLGNVYTLLRLNKRQTNLQDGLYPELVPSMPVETIIFEENMIYSSSISNESDKAWDAILPPGRGYIFAPAKESPIIEEGEETKYGRLYSVAVFHQLHCLGMLRNVYGTLISKAVNHSPDLKEYAHTRLHNTHTNHCFDYLRQALMCGGDMALEWPRTEKDGSRAVVDGWGVPHMCKSWDAIMEYMNENHFNASKRTDITGE